KFQDLKLIDSPKLHLISLEVSSEESIANAVALVSTIVGEAGLDILINNAGIYHTMLCADEIPNKAELLQIFEINSIAPLILSNKFRALLKKAATKKGSAQIANISSGLGSLEMALLASDRPPVVYAMSKAALNMLTRKLSSEWKEDGIRATSFCPGWVRTDMGTQAAALDLDESTGPLSQLIRSLQEDNNGLYYSYNGDRIPW
ncbi:hypothetical protein PFISCL1PPCAC_26844, partial [Pristionchus fissidentatus]